MSDTIGVLAANPRDEEQKAMALEHTENRSGTSTV
jgi:hypothetical protein